MFGLYKCISKDENLSRTAKDVRSDDTTWPHLNWLKQEHKYKRQRRREEWNKSFAKPIALLPENYASRKNICMSTKNGRLQPEMSKSYVSDWNPECGLLFLHFTVLEFCYQHLLLHLLLSPIQWSIVSMKASIAR